MSETEKAQMAEIRAARGRVKASLTRLENTFDEINTRNEISIRLSRLDDLFKEFERLDSNLSLEESELQEFEERYFYLNAKFNDKLDELNVQNQGEQASSKDCWLIYLLLQKIDPESRRLWAIKSSEEEFPNMKAFLDFLNVRCSSLELMSNNESECKIPIRNEEFMSPKECDIILGSDCFFDILRSGKIVGSKNEPIAQRTMFGWVVAGKLNVKNKEPHELYSHFLSTANELNTDSLLQRFWETEELSVKKQFLSDEEQFCENHFKSNFKYDEGRFVVKLPIYRDTSRLGNTKGIVISRLLAMERRFQVDKDFERQYKNFMIEYESLGHMMPVENNEKSMDPKIYFLPHHAVMKGDSVSTKLRVVFDGTCKPSNGNSLNSILGIGKMLQPDLFTILVKFRLNEIAFSTDIQQMYRQILIDQEDQNFQRIVWRESKDSPIREYKLCTVTYGTASAPYLATRCLFQTGLDLERDDPAVSSLIKESFYIDDLMAGAPSSEEAISLIKTLSNILEARGFHLRKWRSNSSEVLSRISSNWVGDSSNLEIHPDECSKALGLTWNSMKDIFIFNLKVNFPDNITKRSFLSQSARLFDPLGFLTPCTVSIKIFYQQLWLLKLDWDSPLPEALATKWKTFQKEFEQVCSIHIPRWIHTANQQITLHGFCDASELAYQDESS
ncbi:DUF1758 domain-containing protein [Trichonephila clavipes]|nr:DUF1758 domain-containing protein [Trichonephila clavipes]